jgi:hypothetical protein
VHLGVTGEVINSAFYSTGFLPPELATFKQALALPPAQAKTALLFVGRFRAHSGPKRLVVLEIQDATQIQSSVFSSALSPSGLHLVRTASVLMNHGTYWVLSERGLFSAFRLYSGQPDDKDPSHFTIALSVHGQSGVIDGWLRPDDTVRLSVRGGVDILRRRLEAEGFPIPPSLQKLWTIADED